MTQNGDGEVVSLDQFRAARYGEVQRPATWIETLRRVAEKVYQGAEPGGVHFTNGACRELASILNDAADAWESGDKA